MAKVKDLLVNGSSRFIGKIYASDQFISQVANGTAPFVVSSSTVVANLNADMTDGLHVHTRRNNEVNKIVRTDGSGYIQTGYINTNVGTENLAISRIFYEYNNDGYIRKMSPSSFFSVLENSGNDISITVAGQNRKLTVGYASNSDKLDNIDSTGFLKNYSQNYGSSISNAVDISPTLTAGLARVHISGIEYSSVLTGYDFNNKAWQLRFRPSYNDGIYFRSQGVGTAWKKLAFIDSNVASSSKWATPRTITLTGSVTGSVSIDGSQNVSLATTTNHTHSYAGSSAAGGDATRALAVADYGDTRRTIQIGYAGTSLNTSNLTHIAGYTNGGTQIKDVPKSVLQSWLGLGSAAYTNSDAYAAASHTHSYLPLTGGTITGYLTLKHSSSGVASPLTIDTNSTVEVGQYFRMSGTNKGWIGYHPNYGMYLYTYNGQHKLGIKDDGIGYIDTNTILHSGNYNSYAPTLTGTGATGTWGISITGNAATATNADTLDGYHASSVLTANYSATIDLNEISVPSIYRLSTAHPNLPSAIFNYGNLLTVKYPTTDTAWQLIGSYNSDHLWFRRGTWYANGTGTLRTNAWKIIAFTDSNISGNAATATNADTLDGYHASNLVKFYLSPMASGAPADSAKSWFVNTMPSGTGAIVYNVPGSEKTIIAGKSTGPHGHMLQLNYDDNYLRILRYYQGSWKTTDWEKVSAGYADAAKKARYLQADNDAASPGGALLRSGSGRADTSPSGDTWIFWDELGGTSSYWGIRHNQANNSIGFCGAGSETSNINLKTGKITSKGFILTGSSSSYVLLGDGGHKLESSLSVNYANSAGNADTVDGQHFNWNNNKNDHTYLWAASSDGQAYLVRRASMSVNYANSAGNADTAGSVAWANVTGKSIGLVIVSKNSSTSTAYSSINFAGCLTASASGSGGTITITVTSNSSKLVKIACSVSSVYPAKSYEFGWAHFTSSPSTSISANSSATFNISFGYIHCQGNWSAKDYVQRGSGGYTFSCIAYYED